MELEQGVDVAVAGKQLNRSFNYVCPVSVTERADAPDEAGSVVRMMVRLPRPYWPGDGDSADDNWSQILRPWLKDKLYKVGSVIKGYDRFAEEEGDEPLNFESIDVSLGGTTLALELDADHDIDPQALEMADRYRELRGTGQVEADARLEIPALLWVEQADGPVADERIAQASEQPDAQADTIASQDMQADVSADQAAPAKPAKPALVAILAPAHIWRVCPTDGASYLLDSATCEHVDEAELVVQLTGTSQQ